MNIDLEFLRQAAEARWHVGKWLNERPNRGLDVTDVATVVAGFDHLAYILHQITGKDITQTADDGHVTMSVTYLEDQ